MNTPAQQFPGIATVLGFQENGCGGGFWLYNLTVDIPGHQTGSTVTERTLTNFRRQQRALTTINLALAHA